MNAEHTTKTLASVAVPAARMAPALFANERLAQGADNSPIPYAVLVKLLHSARQALDGDGDEAKRFIANAAGLFDAEIHRRGSTELPQRSPAGNHHLAPWQSRRAIEFVEENLGGTIRLEDLAASARLSPRQFSRAFSRDFGESPYAYVLRRRIERAKEMMLLTEESLAFIAVRCGFSDQPHLTRVFRRVAGESPGSWRQRHRSAKAPRESAAFEKLEAMAA